MTATKPSNPSIKITTIFVDLSLETDSSDFDNRISSKIGYDQSRVVNKIKTIISHHRVVSATPIKISSSQLSPPDISVEDDCKAKKSLSESILKFHLAKDKITQLTSHLLKSWVYHYYFNLYSYQRHPNTQNDVPIVILPRTEYRKPFINLEIPGEDNNTNHINNTTALSLPFSISHQYPITALSFITIDPDFLQSYELPLIGMDVVIFDQHQRISVDEFLTSFQESFTAWEWRRINNGMLAERDRLIEFYLRWAMKEAYTKALGLGLGKEFKTFEAHLIGFDTEDLIHKEYDNVESMHIKKCSLWNFILNSCRKNRSDIVYFPSHLYEAGTTENSRRDDNWSFYFVPISNTLGSESIFGCACLCVNNRNEDNVNNLSRSIDDAHDYSSIVKMSIHELCEFHATQK